MDPAELRSSWIKWARAIELRQELARGTREYGALHAYEYVREDNSGAFDDPLIRAHWKLALDPLRINSSTATVSQRRIPYGTDHHGIGRHRIERQRLDRRSGCDRTATAIVEHCAGSGLLPDPK
jgi:hypothetical protein